MASLTRDDIDRLSAEERLALIGQLWDSLTDSDAPLTEAQRDELGDRLASFEGERSGGVPWDVLEAELADRTS